MSGEHDTNSLEAVARLRRLDVVLPQLGPAGVAAAEAVTRCLCEAPQNMTLDRAFGVAPGCHRWPWWRLAAEEGGSVLLPEESTDAQYPDWQ